MNWTRYITFGVGIPLLVSLLSCGQTYQEAQPVREDITIAVFASGTLVAADSYTLTAQTEGYLEEVNFTENQLVNKGQVLAVINNKQNQLNARSAQELYELSRANIAPSAPALAQARNNVQQARLQLTQDSTTAARYRVLNDANAVAKIDFENKVLQYQQAQHAYQNALEDYELLQRQAQERVVINASQRDINQTLQAHNTIKAVRAGKVYQKFKAVGDYVHRGEAIAQVGNANQLYAEVRIDERSMGQVRVGQQALISLNIDKDKSYAGRVAEIYPTFDETTQSFTAKITFAEPPTFDIIHTQLQANIIIEEVENALLIPREFLGYGNEVLVKGEKSPTAITTRVISSDWVQVLDGIDEHNTLLATQP